MPDPKSRTIDIEDKRAELKRLEEEYAGWNVRRLLETRGEEYGDKALLVFEEDGKEYSYAEMNRIINRTANLLKSRGIKKGDRVALLLPNIPEFLFVYWGCMKIGAAAAPVNILLKAPEIKFVMENSESKLLFTVPEFVEDKVLPVLEQLPLVSDVYVCEGDSTPHDTKNFHAEIAEQSDELEPADLEPDDEAMIIYTSGTTGKPKGVLLSHRNLIMDAVYIGSWFEMTPETRMRCILPLFHVNGEVVTCMTPLWFGGSFLLTKKFSATRFWKIINRYKVNVVSVVPTILSMLMNHPKPDVDISCLEFIICGAAPLPVEVHNGFEDYTGVTVYEGYGLSETTCYSSFNPRDLEARIIGSIGLAVGNDMDIWDESNDPVPPGTAGEIVCRGENVMLGYFKRPEANEEALVKGWFKTGDWGRMEPDGFYYIMDRVKDMIIRAGENIYPREIDEILYTHPDIVNAATIGVPDEIFGEEVKSYVVLKEGAAATEEEIIAFCKERIADFKCPKSVAFINEIPKGPTGKLLRRELREKG